MSADLARRLSMGYRRRDFGAGSSGGTPWAEARSQGWAVAPLEEEDHAMPNWDRYCIMCGQDGSYLDFDPPYGEPSAQRCSRHSEDGCGLTVDWLEDNEDRPRAGGTKVHALLSRRS